jgi:hypothetical protein
MNADSLEKTFNPIDGTFLILLANSRSVFSVVPTGLTRVCMPYVPAVNYWAIINCPYRDRD